ncbi:MAG: class I SAM-dependent methyltransferase [Acidobacteria bacterium]|nr:class I SAM-dependent methyltransferase [Acidobacteriota bacterium]
MREACPACGGQLESWGAVPDRLTDLGIFSLGRCRSCASLVMQPLPAQRQIPAFYPADYWYRESDQSWVSRLEWRYRRWVLGDHVRFVTRFLKPGARLLDVGCGGGTFLFLLKQRGYQVKGLDFSPQAAAEALRRYRVPVAVGSLRDQKESLIQWAPEVVTLFHVLEHLIDPGLELKQIHAMLPPAGQLFLQVPNVESWQSRFFRGRWYGLDVPRHVVNYSAAGLRAVLRSAGFDITHGKAFSLRDNSASWASSLLPAADPLRRKLAGRGSGINTLSYAGLVAACQPLAALEAAWGRGGTLFVRAVKKSEGQ